MRFNEDGLNPHHNRFKDGLTQEVKERGPESIADVLHDAMLEVGELEPLIEGAATFVFGRKSKERVCYDGVE